MKQVDFSSNSNFKSHASLDLISINKPQVNKNGTVLTQLEPGGLTAAGSNVPRRKTESASKSKRAAHKNIKVMSGDDKGETPTS